MSAAAELPPPQAAIHRAHLDAAEYHRRVGAISRQSAVYFSGTILTAAAGYFFKIYLARTLGAEALGLYALGMSLVALVGLFGAAGLPQAAARFISEYAGKGEFLQLGRFCRGTLGILCGTTVLIAAFLLSAGRWIAVHFYHAPALSSFMTFFVLIMFFGVLSTFFGQAMAGYQDVARRTVITHFIGTPANIVLAVALISMGFGLKGYLAAQVISAFCTVVLLAAAVWKTTPVQARVVAGPAVLERRVIEFSATAIGLSGIELLLNQADKIVLGFYLSPAQVGVYAVAMALVAFVPIALQSVNQIFSPTIAELHATGCDALLQQLYGTLTKWVVILTFPLALAMIVFSRPLIALFGHDFERGAAVVIIGAAGQLINCAVGSVGYLLLMSGNQLQLAKIQFCSAVLMISLSIFLVPRLGIAGAALATALAVTSTNIWCLCVVWRRLKLFPYNSGYLKLIPSALFSGVLLTVLSHAVSHALSPWISVAMGFACAYLVFGGILLIHGLDENDRQFVQMAWNKLSVSFAGVISGNN